MFTLFFNPINFINQYLIFFFLINIFIWVRSELFNKLVFSMACPGKYNPWNVLAVTHECHYGDWVFLYYIAKNMDNYVFRELLVKLAGDLEERRQNVYNISNEEKPLNDKGTQF